MSKEPRKINWRRIFVEAAAIVVSILLAFAVDAWWRDRSEWQRLINGLENLQTELRANLAMIERYEQLHQGIVEAGVALLNTKPADVTVEQCGHVFVEGWVTDYSTGALDIVLGSTRLDLIDDQQLRTELVALPAGYLDAVEDERWAIDKLMDKWIPYISTVMPVGRLWAVAMPDVDFPVSEEVAPADIARAAKTLEFRNHVTNRIGHEILSIDAMRDLREKLEALIGRIDSIVE